MAERYEYDEEQMETDVVESGTLALLNKSEIDQQIATAKKWPRSIKRFRDECLNMVTLTEKVAEECIYALPRDGKTIEGPSARFAEVIASAWGNCRAGARVVSEDSEFVTAQGAFYDLERNVAIQYEVRRRITDRHGNRYKADMVGVTANAACSIALRNAILKGVPKAFWADMYDAARKAAIGDIKSLANKRAEALGVFQKIGVTPDMIFATLGIAGVEDIGFEEMVTLKGTLTAIKEGETTIEQAFGTKNERPDLPNTIHRKSETDPMVDAKAAQERLARLRAEASPKTPPSEPAAAPAVQSTSPQAEQRSSTSTAPESANKAPDGIRLNLGE